MFCPAVNEGKSQISSYLKLLFQYFTKASNEPIFIMAIFRNCDASTDIRKNVNEYCFNNYISKLLLYYIFENIFNIVEGNN